MSARIAVRSASRGGRPCRTSCRTAATYASPTASHMASSTVESPIDGKSVMAINSSQRASANFRVFTLESLSAAPSPVQGASNPRCIRHAARARWTRRVPVRARARSGPPRPWSVHFAATSSFRSASRPQARRAKTPGSCAPPGWHGSCGVQQRGRVSQGCSSNREGAEMDLLYIGLTVGFFALSWVLVVACERLS